MRSGARRLWWVGLFAAVVGGFLAYMVVRVPVVDATRLPPLTRAEVTSHWGVAAGGFAIVVVVDAVVLLLAGRKRHRRAGWQPSIEALARTPNGSSVAGPLRPSVPGWALVATAAVSLSLLGVAVALHRPLWQSALWVLLPWLPAFVYELGRKYERYGFFAIFMGLAVLEVGHLGEHTTQVAELMVNHGDLAKSHGVFGQLDFETVHFVWDTMIWLGGAVLVYRYRRNAWLWASWAFAGVHQVEHIYLFTISRLDPGFWARGGLMGIMGRGGLIGSPLARPYLHFAYNVLVVVPMVVGFLEESRRIRNENAPDPAAPLLPLPVLSLQAARSTAGSR